MANPKIVDASEIKMRPRKSPATRLAESLPDGMLSARQVAEHFDVNIETIRRLARAKDENGKPKFNAPSKAARQGDLIIWAYTQEDMDELSEYFGVKTPKRKKAK